MSVLQMYNILLQTVLLFVILPQLNLGLSDYKICGDSECESPMSRVQAIRDHHGTDCRFLNFKQGEIIFVYHKLTGKREDLWAGTIDKQFGYFPKNAVREEHFHTTMEIVVATQESDFFCMDEFGHLIDYSHLDRVGGETKVSTQDTETPQTTLPADDTNAESLSKFVSADSSATVQSLNTLNEMDGRKYEDATAAQGQTQPHNEKGGSASASWPGSSVTGWFGLTAVEQPESTTEQEEQGESQPEASFTSTMTGWLGLGGQEKPAVEDSVNTDSLALTMTRWLEFGGKEKTDHMSERQQDTEKESGLEQEPAEKYRSRRMSMNIEDTQKETEGTSTLEWLGNGLSNRFGLSLSNQESEHMDPTLKDPKETPKEEEQPGSWFDIQDILGFNKGKIVVGSTESNVKGTEQRTGVENVNSGQSQPGLMEQVVAETNSLSEEAETQKDENQPSEREMSSASADSVTGDSNGDDLHLGTSDTGKDKLSSEGLAYRDAQKDISTVGEISSMFNSLFYVGRNEGVQDNIAEDSQKDMVPVDGEESAEMKDKNHQVPNTIQVEERNREPGEENTTVPDQSFTTHSSASSDVLGPTACEDGKRADEEKAQTPDFKDSVDRFLTSRDRDYKGHDAERTLPDYNYSTAQDQGSKGEIDQIVGNQLIMSSGSAGEYREQVSHEDDNLTSQETGVAPFDSLLMTDKVAEAHPDRSEKEGEMLRAGDIAELIQSPQPADGSIKNMTVDVSEDDIGKTTQATEDDNTAGRKSESDADIDAGATMDGENIVGGDIIKETALQTSVDLQTEIKQMEKDEKTEDIMRTEEVKPADNHQAEKEVEQEEIIAMGNGIEGEETQGEGEEINKDKVVVQGAQMQKGELTVEEEEVKKVETQQLVFGAKDEKLEDKVQESKEDLRKEDVTQAEERIDEGQSSPYLKADAESVIQSETQSEGSSGISTHTEKGDAKALQDKEEGRHQEEKVKSTKEEDSQANEMTGSRDEPDCLMDRCSEAPANRDGNTLGTERSSTHLEGTQTGEQHPPTEKDQDITESLGRTDFESMEEEEEGRKQVEQDGYDSTANTESTGNTSNVAESTKDSADNSKELLYSSVMNDDQLNSAEVEKTGYTEENTLHQGEKSDTEMVNNSTSKDHKMDTVDDSGKAEVLMTMEDDPASPNPGPEVRTETVNEVVVEDESGGGLSLLKGTFGYFSQTPATKLVQNLDSNAGEVHGSLISEPELDSTDVYAQDVTTVPPITPPQPAPQQESQPSPPPTQTASPLHPHPTPSLPATPHDLHQTKGLSKHYKNLLAHMSVEEMGILLENFGTHKLQFLDYICGRSEPMIEELDHDESILLDVEGLLHYHLDALKSPRTRLTDAPQEEKEKTRTFVALEKLQLLVARVKEMFNRRKLDVRSAYHQAEGSCDDESCSAIAAEQVSKKRGDSSVLLDAKALKEEGTGVDKGEAEQLNRDTKESVTLVGKVLGGAMKPILKLTEDVTPHARVAREHIFWLTGQVVSALPDDIRPGPDLYGMPWEPVIISGLLGLITMLLFTCRCYSSVKSRMYRSKERWMAEQVAQLLNEKCKVLETLSKCQQEYEDLESLLRDSGVLAQTQRAQDLESEISTLGHGKNELKEDLEQLKDQLDQQREYKTEQERRITELEESMKTFDEETKDLQLQHEQAQTTLKVYNMNSDRLQRNLETAKEENTLLQESNAQLGQQVEGWAERVSELEEEMSRCKVTHSVMQQDVANKDECIMSLTDQLLRIKAWDSDLEEETTGGATEIEKNGRDDAVDKQGHVQKVQKLIYAAKLNADLKSVDEDKDRVFAKLNDEVKAKEDLLVSIKEMEKEKFSLQSDSDNYSNQVQRLQQKLQIMTEMYQENEMKLHRLLTVEEKERLQKEEKLNKADRNIALAMEELNNYRQRAAEMEEELEKTKQSYQTQISSHEKKAHNNWLAARAADRDLSDIRRENAILRQKLTDTQFKIDALDKDPFALDNLARPLPFRAERSLYGPSSLGRPGSETRPFLSPPTLVDGPPAARLSPRAPRGPGDFPGGPGEMERSGGPHSDSGSNSPTWDRDRRGPPPGPPPPGYLFPEPGGPMFRRPPPPPGALGYLPPPGPLPPGLLHPRNLPSGLADGSFRDTSLGPEQDYREPGDRRTPPDVEPRVGGGPPPGPVMGPMDGPPPPRRGPYGPPPPDFYPPRGPMPPMWAPPPPGVMFPPRFPPGGPSLPPPPPHLASSVRHPPASTDPPFPPSQPGTTGAHTPT